MFDEGGAMEHLTVDGMIKASAAGGLRPSSLAEALLHLLHDCDDVEANSFCDCT